MFPNPLAYAIANLCVIREIHHNTVVNALPPIIRFAHSIQCIPVFVISQMIYSLIRVMFLPCLFKGYAKNWSLDTRAANKWS